MSSDGASDRASPSIGLAKLIPGRFFVMFLMVALEGAEAHRKLACGGDVANAAASSSAEVVMLPAVPLQGRGMKQL